MARPIYAYELSDPDFSWLLNSYRETNPTCLTLESNALPVVIIKNPDPIGVPLISVPHQPEPTERDVKKDS